MKSWKLFIPLLLATNAIVLAPLHAAPTQQESALKLRVVNFKYCVEHSKLGKQEQSTFDTLKKQMESNLQEKEKVLSEMARKFEDADFLDTLSLETETEMKRKFRQLNQEYSQIQNQYLQALQQTNMKVLQKLHEAVEKASATFAKQNNIELVLNSEGAFFTGPALDVSTQIISIMDDSFDKDPNVKN